MARTPRGSRRATTRSAPDLASRALIALAVVAGFAPAVPAQVPATDGLPPAVSATFSYTGELVGVGGGARRGTAMLGAAGAELALRLDPLVGWPGAQVFLFVLGTHGGAPSDLSGDVQGVSNLEAPAMLRLEEAWFQQNLFRRRVSWLLGRYDLNTEFYRLQSAALFLNSSFGIGAEFAQSGAAGPSIFPNTAVGTRIEYDPVHNVALRFALLDGVPANRPDGGLRLFAEGDGALLVSEVVIVAPRHNEMMPRQRRFRIGRGAPRFYSAKLALGGWYYTARFPDLADVLPSGAPVEHRGSRGAYLIGDQTIWSGSADRPGVLTAFAQVGVGDGRVNQVGGYAGGGLALTAPLARRPDDQLGVAVAAAFNGSHFERAQAAIGARAATESVIELTYLLQAGAWLAVQPDVQYVIHPGGLHDTRNALVLGLRIAVSN